MKWPTTPAGSKYFSKNSEWTRPPDYYISVGLGTDYVSLSEWKVGARPRHPALADLEAFLDSYPGWEMLFMQHLASRFDSSAEYHLRIFDDDTRFHFKLRFV